MIDPGSRDFVASLARGLEVLTCFDRETRSMTIAEASARIDISRAAARRLLLTLEALGYVTSDGKRFSLAPKVLDICQSYLASMSVTEAMQPILERASRTVDETCCLAIRDGDEIVFIARHVSGRFQHLNIQLGTRLPIHATAIGRVILGELSNDDLARFLDDLSPEPVTTKTLTDKKALRSAIREAGTNGYAVVDGELQLGSMSIAVPVFDRHGKIFGGVNFGGNTERFDSQEIEKTHVPVLRSAALEIGRLVI